MGGGFRGYLVGDDGWSKPAILARAVFEFAQLVLHVLYFALCVLYFIELLFVKIYFRQKYEKESKASLPRGRARVARESSCNAACKLGSLNHASRER